MINCSEAIRRVSRVNYILICLFVSLSITSHLIAYRLVSVLGFSIFPSSLTYMLCFVMVDIMSSYNPVRFMWLVISMESIANLIMVSVTHFVIYAPHPEFFIDSSSYIDVFSPVSRLYWANIVGGFIGFAFNSLIFIYFYRKRKMPFIMASILSSLSVVVVYTTITDYFAFDYLYKSHISELVFVNIVSNLFFIVVFSIPSRIAVRKITGYINRGE